ncbi:MAG: SusD/RagB family nutrient-binding outer membrane lipoprotein [Bacteroidales bacterium]|nr:SusD/RagB family nutrient-binding outer membrane lipoprotein [Bacteroidales bacterium]
MQNINKINRSAIFILILIVGIFNNSCIKDNLTDLNVDPNQPTYIDPALLFVYSLEQGVGNYNSDVNVEQWGMMNWCMYFASKNGVVPGDEYVIPGSKDLLWDEQYANALINTQEALNIYGDSTEYTNHIAALKIWKTFLFHRITDLWGDIPYFDALKGYQDLTYQPEYSTQQDIYLDMLTVLKTASESINETQGFFNAETDLIYQGDILKWKTFANSLRLRLAIRIKYADPEKYAQEMSDLQALDFMNDNLSSALFPFNSDKKNHVYEADFTGEAEIQNNPSKFLVDILVNTSDPRVSIFLEKSTLSAALPWFDEYKGIPNLLDDTHPEWENFDIKWGDISKIGNWFVRAETPGVFISYSEVCFLKAEAALDAYFGGNAQEYYEEGVEANIKFYGDFGETEHIISQTDIDNYIASIPTVSLEQIINQKWISFAFENGYEAYAEYRRTGFPSFKQFDGSDIDQSIYPNRLPYPNTEITLNQENYNTAIQNQGLDNETIKLWWDKN